MKRRRFIESFAGCAVAAPFGVKGQTARSTYRIGLLHPASPPLADPVLAGSFTVPLRELGYVEGRNLVIERRYALGKVDRLPGLARELVESRVDVILALGPSAIKAAKEATTTIPIVLLTGGDPIAAGLVTSLARPGGNVTGVLIAPEGSLAEKRLQFLRDMVPRATHIALLIVEDAGPSVQAQIQETVAAASSLGLQLDVIVVKGDDYSVAFDAMSGTNAHALVVGAQSILLRDRKRIIELAAKHRLPAIYEWPRQVRDGGLMSYGASDVETYKQVAVYLDRILKGAKPGDLPIWQPDKLQLVINLKTAKALGLKVPHELLLRVGEVIE